MQSSVGSSILSQVTVQAKKESHDVTSYCEDKIQKNEDSASPARYPFGYHKEWDRYNRTEAQRKVKPQDLSFHCDGIY